MMKVVVLLGKTIKWGFIALVIIYVVLLAINAKDEEPSPEFLSIQTLPKITQDKDNAYLALVGMIAPEGEDVFDYGNQWVETYAAANTNTAIEQAKGSFLSGKSRAREIKFQGNDTDLCNPSKDSCVSLAKENSASRWKKLADDNQILVDRESRMVETTRYEESYFLPLGQVSPIPSYPTNAHLLMLDLIALDSAEGRVGNALEKLESRIAFDRQALLGSHGLINALVASSWLRSDYALLADIVGSRPPELIEQKPRLLRMTEPLTLDQIRDVAVRMHEGGARLAVSLFSTSYYPMQDHSHGDSAEEGLPARVMKKLLAPLYKHQATQNLVASIQSPFLLRLTDFMPELVDAWIERDTMNKMITLDAALYSWDVLYNPVGKFNAYIMGLENGFRDRYTVRLSDLAGIISLSRLQIGVVTEGVKDSALPAYLAINSELYNPYTTKPMGWNYSARQLYFDTHPQGNPEHIQVGI
jgi:hypothetical protein